MEGGGDTGPSGHLKIMLWLYDVGPHIGLNIILMF